MEENKRTYTEGEMLFISDRLAKQLATSYGLENECPLCLSSYTSTNFSAHAKSHHPCPSSLELIANTMNFHHHFWSCHSRDLKARILAPFEWCSYCKTFRAALVHSLCSKGLIDLISDPIEGQRISLNCIMPECPERGFGSVKLLMRHFTTSCPSLKWPWMFTMEDRFSDDVFLLTSLYVKHCLRAEHVALSIFECQICAWYLKRLLKQTYCPFCFLPVADVDLLAHLLAIHRHNFSAESPITKDEQLAFDVVLAGNEKERLDRLLAGSKNRPLPEVTDPKLKRIVAIACIAHLQTTHGESPDVTCTDCRQFGQLMGFTRTQVCPFCAFRWTSFVVCRMHLSLHAKTFRRAGCSVTLVARFFHHLQRQHLPVLQIAASFLKKSKTIAEKSAALTEFYEKFPPHGCSYCGAFLAGLFLQVLASILVVDRQAHNCVSFKCLFSDNCISSFHSPGMVLHHLIMVHAFDLRDVSPGPEKADELHLTLEFVKSGGRNPRSLIGAGVDSSSFPRLSLASILMLAGVDFDINNSNCIFCFMHIENDLLDHCRSEHPELLYGEGSTVKVSETELMKWIDGNSSIWKLAFYVNDDDFSS